MLDLTFRCSFSFVSLAGLLSYFYQSAIDVVVRDLGVGCVCELLYYYFFLRFLLGIYSGQAFTIFRFCAEDPNAHPIKTKNAKSSGGSTWLTEIRSAAAWQPSIYHARLVYRCVSIEPDTTMYFGLIAGRLTETEASARLFTLFPCSVGLLSTNNQRPSYS
jgi:hypothetical protein